MPENDSIQDELDAWFATLVAEYSEPIQLAEKLAKVKVAAAHRRVARRMVLAPVGGLLVRHAMAEIARYFRRELRGEVDLLQVSRATGIPLSDSRAVLREFAAAGMLTERIEAAEQDGPPRRFYELTETGGTLAGEVVAQADALQRARGAGRPVGELSWEGA